jgi:hypothetical protein
MLLATSSSFSSFHPLPPPVFSLSTYLTRPQHALTPIFRAADNSYYLIPQVFEMYEASPSFKSLRVKQHIEIFETKHLLLPLNVLQVEKRARKQIRILKDFFYKL